ncbi:MAG: hypothetical protein HY675_22425 [Chloroflexi bacterium]|nr:hypothetical protein [Chloroflexota bacterium]
MSSEERSADLAHLAQLVAWLEEQRNLDKEQVAKLQREGEHLVLEFREVTRQLADVQDDIKQSKNRSSVLPYFEDGLRQVREQTANLQQRVEAIVEGQDRAARLRQTEQEREKKGLAELEQHVGQLLALAEQHGSRFQSLAEEIRRDRAFASPLAEQIANVGRQASTAMGRILLFEEQIRRTDSRVAALEQLAESIRSEHARISQWQQAADLRWNRQLAEWQQQLDEWHRELDGQVTLLQQTIRQQEQRALQLQDLNTSLEDSRKVVEGQASEILRLETARIQSRDEAVRLEQLLEAQRRRLDEQAGATRQLQEQVQQNVLDLAAVSGRVDGERRRLDETGTGLRQVDELHKHLVEDISKIQGDTREISYQLEDRTLELRKEFEEVRRLWEEQFLQLQALAEEHKVREVAEVERQLLEIRDRLSKSKGRVAS